METSELDLELGDDVEVIQPEQFPGRPSKTSLSEAFVEPRKAPVLSKEALPGLVGEIVELATRDNEADPAAVLPFFLTYFGAEVGGTTYVVVGEDLHPARLNCLILGASSKARKGTSKGPILRIMQNLPGPRVRCTPGPMSSGEGLIHAVRNPSKTRKKGETIPDPGISDKRLMICCDEYAACMQASKRVGSTLTSVKRCLWDNGNVDPMTKNDPVTTTGAHVCWVGHITKFEFLKLSEQCDLVNGIGNRILYWYVRRQKLVPRPTPMPDDEVDRLVERLADVLQHARDLGSVTFTPAANRVWDKMYPALTLDREGLIGEVTSRAEAQVTRLALIYALLDRKKRIDVPHLKAALAAWQYCLDSAAFVFGSDAEQCLGDRKLKILNALKEGAKSSTEIHKLFSGNLSASELSKMLSELQASGMIGQEKFRNEKGGRPSVKWALTPGFVLPDYMKDVSNDEQ